MILRVILCTLILGALGAARAAPENPPPAPGAELLITPPPDPRQRIRMTAELRRETLRHMRGYLVALAQIDEALAAADYSRAAEVAAGDLGISARRLGGEEDAVRFMPQAMRQIYSDMHRSAGEFAALARAADSTVDLRGVLAARGRLMRQCVACHDAYRVQ